MKKKKNRKQGFTLAEVLITLSIIGVAAALTIPTLIQRTGNEELVSRLMKTYSTLSQAAEMTITELGSPKVWNTDSDALYEAFKSHLRNSKECGSSEGCWSQYTAGKARLLDGTIDNGNFELAKTRRKLILSDGASLSFSSVSQDCDYSQAEAGLNNRCGTVWVDINGAKAPNQIGRDMFVFGLKNDGIYPAGVDAEDIEDVCNPNGSSAAAKTGFGCAARVITEGAMNY